MDELEDEEVNFIYLHDFHPKTTLKYDPQDNLSLHATKGDKARQQKAQRRKAQESDLKAKKDDLDRALVTRLQQLIR